MREYCWSDGNWLTDGHSWCMLMDIPKLPREDTRERVVLQPPKWVSIDGLYEVPPVECKIYFVPDAEIYIAIGEKANGYLDVLFYDMITVNEGYARRFPRPIKED